MEMFKNDNTSSVKLREKRDKKGGKKYQHMHDVTAT